MFTALLVLQVLMGLAIIALVLLQQGKGADMGAAFGAGASGTVFGARGSGSFFTRATAVLATLFFVNSLLLSSPLVLGERHPSVSVNKSVVTQQPQAPAKSGDDTDAVDLPPVDLPEAPPAEGSAEPKAPPQGAVPEKDAPVPVPDAGDPGR